MLSLPGVGGVELKMNANVPNDGRPRGLLDLPIRNAVAVASGVAVDSSVAAGVGVSVVCNAG